MNIHTDKTPKKENLIMSSLKVFGMLILSVVPINLAVILIALQDKMESISGIIPWLLGIAWIILIVFLIRWMWQYYLKIYSDERAPLKGRDIILIVGLFIFLRIVAIGGTLLNESLTGNEMTSNDAALSMNNPLSVLPIYFIIFQLTVGLVAPILEELAFRGLFSHLLFDKDSFWLPGLVSSTIFSVMHGFDNPLTFSMYFIMGFTFYYTYKRRNTITDSILLHILNNSLAAIFAIVGYISLYLQ